MTASVQRFNTDSLVTPSPYHIPGYGGYIPQRKYKIGGTFSKTTHEILIDDSHGSGNLILEKIKPIKTRTPRYHSSLIPGYTGYIPKGEHWFALPYVTACSYAKGDHVDAMSYHTKQREKFSRERAQAVPLTALKRGSEAYVSQNSIYNGQPDYHISGYTGFLPMARNKISMGYPTMTKQAIAEYRENEKHRAWLKEQPPRFERSAPKSVIRRVVYPKESGMVPHYTGHVPGEKFKYGNTFGTSTHAALKSMDKATE